MLWLPDKTAGLEHAVWEMLHDLALLKPGVGAGPKARAQQHQAPTSPVPLSHPIAGTSEHHKEAGDVPYHLKGRRLMYSGPWLHTEQKNT